MSIQILRNGCSGKEVARWQLFLIGQKCLRNVADGAFGPITEQATRAFQRGHGLTADGIVGPKTLGTALVVGYDAGFVDKVDAETNPVLVGTAAIKPATISARERMFGCFEFEPSPTAQNPECIAVLDDWEQQNITTVNLPQLKGVPVFGRPSSGRMRFHRRAEDQLKALWAAWEQAGLLHLVLSYDGSYNPRFIRGSRETLSNHAFGSAFDLNAQWNALGSVPALEGREGSLRELIAIANELGFSWGGHYRNRPDGMHFEVARLL